MTTLDHEANVSPWRAMAADRGLVVRTVDIHPEDATLDLEALEAALGSRTKLVAVGYASNAIGTINPVRAIVDRAHEVGALTYVDAVHYAPHGPIDVQALDTDFLACSVYKFFGPHLGVLYGKEAVLDRLPAEPTRSGPAHDRFETGTQNFEGVAGALAAVDYLASVGERYGVGVCRRSSRASAAAGSPSRPRCGRSATYEMGLFSASSPASGDPRRPTLGLTDRSRFAAGRRPRP